MKSRLTAVELALVAAIGWLVWLTRRPSEFMLDEASFDRLRVAALAVAVGGVTTVVVWGASRRGLERIGVVAIASAGMTAVLGTARLTTLPRPGLVVVESVWLSGAATVMVAAFTSSPRLARLPRRRVWTVIGAVGVTGVLAAVLAGGGGAAATFEAEGAAQLMLAAHVAALIVGVVWAAVTWHRGSAGAHGRRLIRDPVVLAVLVWCIAAILERIVHLFPLTSYEDPQRGLYQPWAMVTVVHAPLVACGALLAVLGWTLAVRPRGEPLASVLMVLPDHDPLAMLRDDLAAWAGDPTLQLGYADGNGRWIFPYGPVDTHASQYDRATTTVTRDGNAIGLLDHDVSLAQAPDALQTAAVLAGAAFDANRLLALSEARLNESRQLGERLLTADAITRDEVLAVLEEGPISRLHACADALRFGAPINEIIEPLREVIAEIRLLSHGLYPPELIEGGLNAVLGDRWGAPDRRLPPAVEITAFQLADDDQDSWFEDRGTVLCVHRTCADIQRSTADRVAVLGGWMSGTTVCLPLDEQ